MVNFFFYYYIFFLLYKKSLRRFIKRENKIRLAYWVKENTGIEINIDSMFDV